MPGLSATETKSMQSAHLNARQAIAGTVLTQELVELTASGVESSLNATVSFLLPSIFLFHHHSWMLLIISDGKLGVYRPEKPGLFISSELCSSWVYDDLCLQSFKITLVFPWLFFFLPCFDNINSDSFKLARKRDNRIVFVNVCC